MRIGVDARFWNESGVGRYVRNLVWQLQKIDRKNSYTLFVTPKTKEELTEVFSSNPNWKIVATNIHWHSLAEQIKFPQLLDKERLDLMHFTYFSIPISYSKPFVVTIHDLILHHFSTGQATTRHPLIYHGKRLGYKYIMQKAAQKSKKIITVSNASKQEIIDHLKVPPEKITVTYEGIDPSLKEKATSHLTLNPLSAVALAKEDSPYFLYVGNAYPHKNLERLLSAFTKVADIQKDTQLILVGKKDFFYDRIKKRLSEINMEKKITILHNVTDEKLANLYSHALAVVLPSLMEGFGLPAAEAMANNCLVIASDIPAHREICQDAAIYFDPAKEDELVRKLIEVYENGKEKYQEKIKKGKSRTSEFSWEQMARQTVKVYEEANNEK